MIENTAQDQEQAEPELQIEVTEDPVEEQSAPVSSDDELDTYTKGVSKRINKLLYKFTCLDCSKSTPRS